jgi:outer membrane protein assembly factor BamB
MMGKRDFIAGIVLALVVASGSIVVGADWPTFRGTDRTAVSKETNLLKEWPAGGPPLLWKAEGSGRGYTSLAIVNGRIFLMGDGIADVEDADEYLLCLDARNGKRLWAAKSGPAWKEMNPQWHSSRSTPTVDGNRVYALTPKGSLFCCDVETGREIWRKDLTAELGGKKADPWGYSESVLIDGNHLICTPGGEKTTMAALDKATGNVVWTTVREGDRGAGHASIVISEIGGTKVYVQTTGGGALGVRASDGKLLWSYPIEKTTAVAPTPIILNDMVFFSAGYKRGGALLQQVPGDGGNVTMKEIYGLKSDLSNKHGGIVRVGDYLFGDSDDQGVPFCAEFSTGKVLWKGRGSGKNSIAMAAADGRLYLCYADGTVALAKAEPGAYTEVGSFTAPGSGERPSWSHPVILDGKLYLRENNTVVCYDIRNKNAAQAGGN